MKMILGKKIGMTQCFCSDGKLVPATIVYVEPNLVLENKSKEKHGYVATKIGYSSTKENKLIKPKLGYFKKNNLEPKKIIKEFRDVSGYNVGDTLKVDIFSVGENVDVQAKTIGKGFTGAIKRWNFSVGPKTHGAGYPHRYQGSISFGRGGSQGQRVMKGKKMSGHMGCELVTISNLTVLKIELDKNLILIKGAVPGPTDSILCIKSSNKKKSHKEFNVYSNIVDKKLNEEKDIKDDLNINSEEKKVDHENSNINLNVNLGEKNE